MGEQAKSRDFLEAEIKRLDDLAAARREGRMTALEQAAERYTAAREGR